MNIAIECDICRNYLWPKIGHRSLSYIFVGFNCNGPAVPVIDYVFHTQDYKFATAIIYKHLMIDIHFLSANKIQNLLPGA